MTELRPPHLYVPVLPTPVLVDSGHDWIEALRSGWRVVYAWGLGMWDLGEIPLVIVIHLDDPDQEVYAMALYIERDIELWAFTERAERDAATDKFAADHWRRSGDGPPDLPPEGVSLLPHQRGPFSWDRYEAEKHLLPYLEGEENR
ncbi:hypothetical protein AB0M72_03555 [Nocardiopsis dassonvillei]